MLDAALALVASEGWSALLPARVAKRSGLSQPAVAARFADRSALGVGVWTCVADDFRDAVQEAVSSAGLFDDELDESRFELAVRRFLRPDDTMKAAAELLVIGSFDSLVGEAVRSSLGRSLDEWITPQRRTLSRAAAARRAYVVLQVLGLLLEARRQPAARIDLRPQLTDVCRAMTGPTTITRLPDTTFEHWDGACDYGTGDSLLDRLLEATRDTIGRHGYDATTVDDIAAAAGRTKGLVFSRYASKKQLFLDTVARYTAAMYVENDAAYSQLMASSSAGIAEAVLFRELMRPGREHLRVFTLEQHRLTWHDQEMRDAVAESMAQAINSRMAANPSRTRRQWQSQLFVETALGVGVLLMASCSPAAWELPYQVVTVPLLD